MSKVSDELLPCPFCGCAGVNLAFPRVVEGKMAAVVECFTDGCYAKVTADTEVEALAAWNRRAALEAVSSIHEAETDGWVLLPKKITYEMAYAASEAYYGKRVTRNTSLEGISMTRNGVDTNFLAFAKIFWKAAVAAALYAHPAPISKGVTVRDMEWRKGYCDDRVTIQQASFGGMYQVRVLDGVVWLDWPARSATEFPSVAEAMDAAQAHHAAAVLSCLSHTAGEIE